MNKQLTHCIQNENVAVISRVIAAIVGGYVLSNLLSIILSYLLPGSPAEGVMTAMVVSFAVYGAVVIWVYSVKSLQQVWKNILITSGICIIMIYFLMPKELM
jgi:hypothetical protein